MKVKSSEQCMESSMSVSLVEKRITLNVDTTTFSASKPGGACSL